MKKIALLPINRTYTNNGQHAEQVARYTLTGEICKADNKPFNTSTDCGIYQIKSARATVCKGLDIRAHVAKDKASAYIYVGADFTTAWIMSKEEYIAFCERFGQVTTDSKQNGGQIKIRLSKESKAMRAYLG